MILTLSSYEKLERNNYEITWLKVNEEGFLDLNAGQAQNRHSRAGAGAPGAAARGRPRR